MLGFPGIQTRHVDPEGYGMPNTMLDAVYENGDYFSVDVTFRSPTTVQDGITYSPIIITELSGQTNIDGITVVKKSDDTITISGSPSNVFTDAFYEFKMKDGSIKKLPANTEEAYLSITRWSPPSTKILEDVPYSISLKYKVQGDTAVNEETVTLLQDIYWNYTLSMRSFKTFLSKGL